MTVVIGLPSGAAHAVAPTGADGESKVRARLVTDAASVEPGSSFHLGVVFEIEPGWHIYWRNPGGAGLATEIRWKLPEGLDAGGLRWPLPVAFDQSEGIPGYGYQGGVMLAAEVRSDRKVDSATEVGAAVSWLACREVCVLGSAELGGTLRDLAGANEDFQRWQRELPRAVNPEQPPFSVTTTGGLAEGRLSLWLRWPQAPSQVEWFPDPSDGLEVEVLGVQTRGALTRVDIGVRRIGGSPHGPPNLYSLVVQTNSGDRRGWELDVDLEHEEP